MNYQRVRLCFLVAVFADIAMALCSVPMLIVCLMNVGLYLALVPFPGKRKASRSRK